MSLLEVITKASASIPALAEEGADYPIVLNTEPIFLNLKHGSDGAEAQNPVKKVTGWEISQADNELVELGHKFFKKLRRNLKNTNSFGKAEFLEMVASHLENIAKKIGISTPFKKKTAEGYACKLVEKLGVSMGRDVKGLVMEGCISLEAWELLESLIVNGVVEHGSASSLVHKLIENRRSNLVVSCVKHLSGLQAYDLMCILKYFLLLPSDGYGSLASLRKDWERQASMAIEKASGKGAGGKESLAKEAAVLIMVGHDGFSVSELCLHYLLVSANLDEVIFAACVSKLNGEELKALVQYFGKLLRKYERFPQAGPCPKGSSALGLEVCDWIPSLETVAKYFGVVVDEHYSTLVLHSEFHELISLEEDVSSLAMEARLCGGLANLSERLRIES